LRTVFLGVVMSKKKADLSQFEQAMAELENIVQQLELGDLSLDASLTQFERGISLVKQSQQQLQSAEQKVQLLLQQQQQESLQAFTPPPGE
jgi:exodeoxyribonuclease VII small subunit